MPSRDIAASIEQIREKIRKACLAAGRPLDAVELIAVSKFQPQEAVLSALEAGQRQFGENRVQEAMAKFPALRARYPDLRLHLIGALQTNKARDACRTADVIQTLDRPALSDAIIRAADKDGHLPQLYIQVNIGDEAQKAGIATSEAPTFIKSCKDRFGTSVVGLMAIPPAGCDPTPYFRQLAALAAEHHLNEISMGMSSDFERAIGMGATQIRVGTAIFGDRLS